MTLLVPYFLNNKIKKPRTNKTRITQKNITNRKHTHEIPSNQLVTTINTNDHVSNEILNNQNNQITKYKTPTGAREGLAKSLSNALAYGVDSRKTLYQFHGFIPKLPKDVLMKRWINGITTSSFTAGFVYYLYYSIYNRLILTPYAGPLSALATSFIKLPISNSIKIMQLARVDNLIEGVKYLRKSKTLYSGYALSLIEDTIELDIKNRLYNTFKTNNSIFYNIVVGTCSSSVASAFTTPFDNVRLQMCTGGIGGIGGIGGTNEKPLTIFKNLVKTNSMYKGTKFRVLSNMTKNMSFFFIFEFIKLYMS